MTTLVIQGFGGETPMVSDQKISPLGAVEAKNCRLISGDLRGLNVPTEVQDFSADVDDVKSVFRVPHDGSDIWVRFANETVQFLKGTITDDEYDRFYYTSPDFAPRYSPIERIRDDESDYLLGIPRPRFPATLAVEAPVTLSFKATVTYVVGDVVVARPNASDMLFECIVGSTGEWDDVNWQTFDMPVWAKQRKFDQNEVLWNDKEGKIYTANNNPTGPSDWAPADYTEVPHTVFSEAATYVVDDWVEYKGGIYQARGAVAAGIFDLTEWETRRMRRFLVEQAYNIGDQVIYQDNLQTANVAVEAGPWNSHEWDLEITPRWDDTTEYLTGEFAYYRKDPTDEGDYAEEVIYKANTTTTIGTFDPLEWDETYSMAFNYAGTFSEGEYILHGGKVYQAGEDVVGKYPDFDDEWIMVSWSEGLTVTRAYIFTYISEFGEEGPPSEPVLADGADNGSWLLFNMDNAPEDGDQRLIKKMRIYRTITGLTAATNFFFVADIPIAETSYLDVNTTDKVSQNDPCESWEWYPPPDDLHGIVAHPNGFMVGFRGRDVFFSEPYRPHAWPPELALSTEYDIVGLGIFGSSIGILTDGHPYISSGIAPTSISFIKIQTPEPCIAAKGIVPVLGGILYPSTHGIMVMGKNGVDNLTENIFTRDEWNPYATPELQAARYNNQYVGFHTSTEGMLVTPANKLSMFSQLSDFWEIEAIWTDEWSGEVYILQNKKVLLWNPPGGLPLYHHWKSMDFVTAIPVNLGAYQIDWRAPPDIELDDSYKGDVEASVPAGISYEGRQIFNVPNTARIDDVYNKTLYVPTADDILDDEGASLSIDPATPGAITYSPWLIMRVWADGILRFETTIKTTQVARMPSGFKARRWQFQFTGNGTIKTAKFGTTGTELANV